MRWFLTPILVTVTCLAGCRRSSPPEAEELGATVEQAAAVDQAAPEGQAALPVEVSKPEPAASAAPAIAEPAAAPAEPGAAPSESAPAAQESDDAIYTWTDAEGAHFGSVDDIPDDRRATARRVGGGLTVVERVEQDYLAPAPPTSAGPVETAQPAPPVEPAPARKEPGDRPELDADGLPIPGTMKDTAHIRAIRQATGGVQLDPAAVERQYQQQLRDMKCVEKDGAMVCG